jgi:hypothetical protein
MRRLWVSASIRNRSPSLISLRGRSWKFRKRVSKKLCVGRQSKKHVNPRYLSSVRHRSFVDELSPRRLHKFTEVSKRRRPDLPRKANAKIAKRQTPGPFQLRSLPRLARCTAKRPDQRVREITFPPLELIDWTLQRVQEIKTELGGGDPHQSAPPSTPTLDVMLEVVSSPPPSTQLLEQDTTLLLPLAPPEKFDRKSIECENLETAISNAVKKGVQGCESFVGVIVKRTTPKSKFDTNWTLRGVRFGKVDRSKADKAIALVVERMQREYKLSDD